MSKGYRDLAVWQKSIEYAQEVYKYIDLLPSHEKYALIDQMRRSVVSIPSNIAEGYGRKSNKDFIRFIYIAKGSLCELQTQIELCARFDYCTREQADSLIGAADEIDKMLNGLIHYLKTDN